MLVETSYSPEEYVGDVEIRIKTDYAGRIWIDVHATYDGWGEGVRLGNYIRHATQLLRGMWRCGSDAEPFYKAYGIDPSHIFGDSYIRLGLWRENWLEVDVVVGGDWYIHLAPSQASVENPVRGVATRFGLDEGGRVVATGVVNILQRMWRHLTVPTHRRRVETIFIITSPSEAVIHHLVPPDHPTPADPYHIHPLRQPDYESIYSLWEGREMLEHSTKLNIYSVLLTPLYSLAHRLAPVFGEGGDIVVAIRITPEGLETDDSYEAGKDVVAKAYGRARYMVHRDEDVADLIYMDMVRTLRARLGITSTAMPIPIPQIQPPHTGLGGVDRWEGWERV